MLIVQIFYSFVKLGLIAYGGGPAMIPVMQAEMVDGREWVTDEDFRTALGIGYALPGPIASKMAFWAGWQVAGLRALVATVGIVLPSLALMLGLTRFMWANMEEYAALAGAAKGASIGVVGLLIYIAYDQAFKVFARPEGDQWFKGLAAHPDWIVLVVAVVALSLWRPTIMVPLSIVIAAVYGALFVR